jgi:hypothetical protein
MKRALVLLPVGVVVFVLMVRETSAPPVSPIHLPDPHDHPVAVTSVLFYLPEFAVVGREGLPSLPTAESTVSPGRTYRFVAYLDEGRNDEGQSTRLFRLFIERRSPGRVFEVVGLPPHHQPPLNFVWLDEHTLTFDRRTFPGEGVHIVLDLKHGKLLAVAPFPERR